MPRLIGDDGAFASYSLGTEASGTALSMAAGEIWEITAKGTGTKLGPGAIGDLFINDTNAAIVGVAGDKARKLTVTAEDYITAWEFEFSSEEIDVTTLTDALQTIKFGRSTSSGTVTVLQEFDDNPFLKSLLPYIDFTQTSPSKRARSTTPVSFLGYIAYRAVDDAGSNKKAFLHLPSVSIGGGRLGASSGERQEATYNLSIAPDSVAGRSPTLYVYSA